MEVNLINDKDLKVKILDSTCAYLINNSMLTKEELPYLKAEFGYLFSREDGFTESLYKIIKTNGEIIYMALQENRIMRIDFDEKKFYETINGMKQRHQCLKDREK